MKKILPILFVMMAVAASAQISILRSDFGAIGDKVRFAVDTPAPASLNSIITTIGASKTWNLNTGLVANKYDSLLFVSPLVASNPPAGANQYAVSNSTTQFQNVDSNFVRAVLDNVQMNITGLSLKVFKFPFTFGSVLVDSLIFSKADLPGAFNFTSAQLGGADSMRVDVKAYIVSTGTGYGTINLPDTSCNALQIKTTTINIEVLSIHNSLLGAGWIVANPFVGIPVYQKNVEYSWFAKNSKSAMARALMDTNGVSVQSFIYRTKTVSVPKLTFITPNTSPKGQVVNLTIKGLNTHFTSGTNLSVKFMQGSSMLTPTNVVAVNDTTITLSLPISQASGTGMYDVIVTDPVYGDITFVSSFQVTAATIATNLKSITPNSVSKGSKFYMTINATGTHFTSFAPKVVFSTTSIHADTLKVVNDTTLTCYVVADTSAKIGSYSLTVYDFIDDSLKYNSFVIFFSGIKDSRQADANIDIYPNPASNFVQINFAHINTPVSISVYDITGKVVKSIQANSNISIETNDLKNGVYFFKISGKDFTETRKVIISK
ncbi:MAG: T9SS type A sorting domain-containing protein [Bacteroidota bacterium]